MEIILIWVKVMKRYSDKKTNMSVTVRNSTLLSAGYKDEKLIRSIENAINHSSIFDKKRKSLTLSKAVAEILPFQN